MALYRKFNAGRSSELLMNDELFKNFESTKHLLDIPAKKNATPKSDLEGALWLDRKKNELRYKNGSEWTTVFNDQFRRTGEMTENIPPANPVLNQLWIASSGVMCYWDGSNWNPIKATTIDNSQFNIATFENFALASPLWTKGNVVVDADKAVISSGKPDEAEPITAEKWHLGHVCDTDEELENEDYGKLQYLVPNINIDRIFLDHDIDFNYESPYANQIEYERKYLKKLQNGSYVDKVPSLIHMNPGRLTKMTRRLIKFDKDYAFIKVPTANTEFYGFRDNEYGGLFLRPLDENNQGDYKCSDSGIHLTAETIQNIDYVLAISYEFTWCKDSGFMDKVHYRDMHTNTFTIANGKGPMNVFAEGYNLEDMDWSIADKETTVTIKEDVGDIELSFIGSIPREYGLVHRVDTKGRGIFKTLKNYKHPLVFVNGEALHPELDGITIDGRLITVPEARKNMVWSVMNTYVKSLSKFKPNGEPEEYDMMAGYGIVEKRASTGEYIIPFNASLVKETDDVILFVDGVLISKDDVRRDYSNGTITVPNLTIDQKYIILRDEDGRFYDDIDIQPAFCTNIIGDSLVYMDGKLLNHAGSVDTLEDSDNVKEDLKLYYADGEIKRFNRSKDNEGSYKRWDADNLVWIDLSPNEIEMLRPAVEAYSNATHTVSMNGDMFTSDELKKKNIVIYTFKYASDNAPPINIHNVQVHDGDSDIAFEIAKGERYKIGANALSVWFNGVRQHEVEELLSDEETEPGIVKWFKLKRPITEGIVTYIVEELKSGEEKICDRILLSAKDMTGYNVYRIPDEERYNHSFYPGRIVVYVNGLRQPEDRYSIIDNFTIAFNEVPTKLVGKDYEHTWMYDSLGNLKKMQYRQPDNILIEVRRDYERRENTIEYKSNNSCSISMMEHDIPTDIFTNTGKDEILIFVDGLFWGLRDGNGYELDTKNMTMKFENIQLRDNDYINIIERLVHDPLESSLLTDEESSINKRAWYKKYFGEEYKKKSKIITLDWRY